MTDTHNRLDRVPAACDAMTPLTRRVLPTSQLVFMPTLHKPFGRTG